MKKYLAVMMGFAGLSILAGCGGSGPGTEVATTESQTDSTFEPEGTRFRFEGADSEPNLTTDVSEASGQRVGIQSLYFPALSQSGATKIVNALGAAPSSRTIEIGIAPHFGKTNPWGNARLFLTALPGRKKSLAVHFGHHEMEGSMKDWGVSFYRSVFKPYPNAAIYRLSIANEDTYPDATWSTNMKALLKSIVDEWKKDNKKGTFPAASIVVRRCKTKSFTLSTTFSAGTGLPTFKTEREYHFPASTKSASSLLKSGFEIVSNDGWSAHDSSRSEPKDLCFSQSGSRFEQVPSMPLTDFMKGWGSKDRILWHPALHMWPLKKTTTGPYKSGRYYGEHPRIELTGSDMDGLCKTIQTFVKG